MLKYCAAGFHGFLLDYSTEPTGWPAPTCELSKAVKTVRAMADEYFIDPDKIFVCGFSAGGHLAASLGVYWDLPLIQKGSEAAGEENKPNGLVFVLSGYNRRRRKNARRHQAKIYGGQT